MKNRYKNAKDKRPRGPFVALPHIVLRSAQWEVMSAFAVKLLVDLLAQFNGKNNGDLTTAWTVMAPRGWKSNDSLYKALRELEAGGWIQRTRQGGRHVATLWAITMFALDDDNPTVKAKLDILPSEYRRGAWCRGPIAPPAGSMDGVSCKPPAGSIPAALHRPLDQLNRPEPSIAPPAGSVEPVLPVSLHRRLDTFIEVPSTVRDLLPPSPPSAVDVAVDLEPALSDLADLAILAEPKTKTAPALNEFDRSRKAYERRRAKRATI